MEWFPARFTMSSVNLDSHFRRVVAILGAGPESGTWRGENNHGACVYLPFFTMAMLAGYGLMLLTSGAIFTKVARQAFYLLLKRLAARQRTRGKDTHRSLPRVPELVVRRDELTRRYNFVERRRLELAINGELGKVAQVSRGYVTRQDGGVKWRRLAGRGINGRDVDYDDQGEEQLTLLRERLTSLRSERHRVKQQYAHHLDELTLNKSRVESCRRRERNRVTEMQVVRDDSCSSSTDGEGELGEELEGTICGREAAGEPGVHEGGGDIGDLDGGTDGSRSVLTCLQ